MQNSHHRVKLSRVGSQQKDDLERQIQFMQEKFPNAETVTDIGSGVNFKRKGLKAILERSIRGDSINPYVAHKDRLCRFGFDLIEWIIKRSSGKIVVLDKTVLSPEIELTRELLQILHVFSCRMHGLRNYRKQVNKAVANGRAEKDIQEVD